MRWIPILCLTILSCNGSQQNDIETDSFQTIVIDPDNSVDGLLSESYHSLEYIFLDVPDTVPLVRFYKILLEADKIFIEDRDANNILVFNRHGSYHNVIRSSGMGPKEFYLTEDFQIISNNIVIKDSYLGKEIEFDIDGNYLGEHKPEVSGGNFYRGDDFTLYYSQNFTDLGSYEFTLKDENGLTGLVPFERDYEQVNASSPFGFIFDKFRNQIIFNKPFTPEVYLFDSVGDLAHQLKFDFASANVYERSLEGLDPPAFMEKVRNENLVRYISSFIPLQNGYFVNFDRGYKTSHEVFLSDDFEVQKQIKSAKNDIDGMKIRNGPWYYGDNMIGYIIASSLFYQDYQKAFPEIKAHEANKQIHQFVGKYQDKLSEDSYVLVFFHVHQ